MLLVDSLFVDTKESPRNTFGRAFLKGMAAPVTLFGTYNVEKPEPIEIIDVESIRNGKTIIDDFASISQDLVKATSKL